MSYHCPNCEGVLYDRRRKTCGFCGAELPAHLLFTPNELELLRREEAEAEQRQKEQRARDAREEEARAERMRQWHIPPVP